MLWANVLLFLVASCTFPFFLVPAWKAKFGRECIAPIVQATTQARAPKYSVILELDRKIRDMELPKYAIGSRPEGVGLNKTMSHYMPQNYRELGMIWTNFF